MRLLEFQSAIKHYVKTHTMRPQQLVLVQCKDAEGFWCNVLEGGPVQRAVVFASDYARDHGGPVRVCTGPKRDIVRVFA